ncbi:MAG: CBS domain-containing protein [Planctomycetes bacterium]|nr:CBS domain-containing protein [Planctomycetota bacterium]
MNVEQCMTKNPRACTPGDTLSSVARLLWEHDLGALPVVDAAGMVVGMITDRDVCMAAYTSGAPLHLSAVARHMSHTVFSIGAKADAAKAAELMKARQVRRLPVVENGRLVGMLTLSDFARSSARKGKGRALGHKEVARVLACICEPRASAKPSAEEKGTLQPSPRQAAPAPKVAAKSTSKPAVKSASKSARQPRARALAKKR